MSWRGRGDWAEAFARRDTAAAAVGIDLIAFGARGVGR
jgi:hypothetical protein